MGGFFIASSARRRQSATALLAWALLTIGVMEINVSQSTNPDYDLIGGGPGVDRLVEAFYRNMDQRLDARAIRAMHADDLEPTRKILKLYLREWLGGPKDYSSERGHPRLRRRHARFAIGPAERDAWLGCMNAALDEVVAEQSFRDRLKSSFHKLADWVRNDLENERDQHR